jgi:hypothetical protein
VTHSLQKRYAEAIALYLMAIKIKLQGCAKDNLRKGCGRAGEVGQTAKAFAEDASASGQQTINSVYHMMVERKYACSEIKRLSS